ncbi:HlyIII-domain-containing protein [Venturia nashicola]|uniref:HlyIII-domain-containing protein n=1 Tax=Venturia nashicola TaxID=86259 RepID=A0A4Z1P9B5_9PEZI|nr:HlyIII-domain-containing protein [Venturia nashicola]
MSESTKEPGSKRRSSFKDTVRQAGQAVSNLEQKIERRLTVLWHEAEEWQRDNHFIESGYRPQSNSFLGSLGSLGYLHNESVNIWTHGIGAIVAVLSGIWLHNVLRPRYDTASQEDVFAFSCYFFGATCCLGMSAAYHAVSNHSPEVSGFVNQLDYLGIVSLIWGSFVPSIYYGFQGDVFWVRTYWSMITTIGAGCAMVSINPKFKSPQWRPFRAAMFSAMGFSAAVPVIHGVIQFGIPQMNRSISLPHVLTQGILYAVGTGLYASRIPERFSPGTFDIWGSSHQIFHVLILIATAIHLVGLLHAFDYKHEGPGVQLW